MTLSTTSADSAFSLMEYRAMPLPWTPQRSMRTLSSLEVTRASKTLPRISRGMPSPSSSTVTIRSVPTLEVATKMLLACASRALRSISMTMSSLHLMSWAACLRSASATRRRTKPCPRFSSMRRALSPPILSTKEVRSSVRDSSIAGRYFAMSIARDSRITTTRTWPGYSISSSICCAMSCARTTASASEIFSGSTMTWSSRPACMA